MKGAWFIWSRVIDALRMNLDIDGNKDNTRGKHCMQRHLYEHFNLPGHSGFLNNVSVTLGKSADFQSTNFRLFISWWILMMIAYHENPRKLRIFITCVKCK